MLVRERLVAAVRSGLLKRPVVALLGPRQCGKTTLARELSHPDGVTFFDVENARDRGRLENPMLTLESLRGLVVIDEFQRLPALTECLRVLADRRPSPAKFLILGSASPDLVRSASESLAGRVRFVDMGGFTLDEVGRDRMEALWLRGGFPDSFLADSESDARDWREDFIRTFLERDLPSLGFRIPAERLRRFWTMAAHYHGQTWNSSEIGASMGMSNHVMRDYLDLLAGAFVMRILPPWHANVGKRLVKTPKAYVRDSGILHTLLNIPDMNALLGHPKLGASWEGFALEQILSRTGDRHAYFWGTHGGAELDLLLDIGGRRWGVEFKYADAPRVTASMRSALADLELAHLWVVHPGKGVHPLDEKVTSLGIDNLETLFGRVLG